MKKIPFFIPVFISLLFAFSCSNKYKNLDEDYTDFEGYDDYYDYNYADSDLNAISYKDYQATRTVYTDLINTKLELKPDWSKSYLYGKATITAKPHFYRFRR